MLGRVVAFYPGPAGATESELPLAAWSRIVDANPSWTCCGRTWRRCCMRGRDEPRQRVSCHLVPIDTCYELVGRLRLLWRGFDGGSEVRQAMDEFFAAVGPQQARPRPRSGRRSA